MITIFYLNKRHYSLSFGELKNSSTLQLSVRKPSVSSYLMIRADPKMGLLTRLINKITRFIFRVSHSWSLRVVLLIDLLWDTSYLINE